MSAINRRILSTAAILMLFGSGIAAGISPAQEIVSDKAQKEDAAGFKEFDNRVQDYLKLHKTVAASLPALKRKDLPEMIVAHQQMLARKIREARPNAKAGDIFTHSSHEAFEHAIRASFQGPQATNVRATIKQGAPLKETHVKVNEVYPDAIPYTTVPPTLLQQLPRLPDELGYRIVGRDLVLLDLQANLIVDVIHEIIP